MHTSEPRSQQTPSQLGTVRFHPDAGTPGLFRAALPELPEGEILLQVRFAARGFPFERYCRYARLKEGAELRTFANMELSLSPPGRRVGPWPGWKGIPAMPEVLLRRGSEVREIRFQFWGDEERRGHLRGICPLPQTADPEISLEVQDPDLTPVSVALYRTSRPRVVPLRTTLRPQLVDLHPRLLVSHEII